MAKWSDLKHGSGLDSSDNVVSRRADGFSDTQNCPEVKFGDKLRSLFYKVLMAFLRDVAGRVCINPDLARTGDGQLVDLFQLYWAVRRRGGYMAVSESGEWDSVARELGFGRRSLCSLKLMHFKYLGEFDSWLKQRRIDAFVENENWECGPNGFGALSLELETGFKVLMLEDAPLLLYDDENKVNQRVSINGAEGLPSLAVQCPEPVSRKRKPESLEGMLSWIIRVAKHPDDVRAAVPKQTELCQQALLIREALFQRRATRYNSGNLDTPLQKKLKVHSLSVSTSTRKLLENRLGIQPGNRTTELNGDCSDTESIFHSDRPTSDPPIGPLYQAEVPEWTGIKSESDPKWLGTKVWPPQKDTQSIGRGRVNECSCYFPGSAECARFHTAEKRLSLNVEFGYSLFYDWRFHRMGEEVSLGWTPKEETRFKDIVRLNPPSLGKCFWDDISRYFPKKTREDLVSYYFNVFLLRRRRYQNRVTPKEIDSDDDDTEFGSFGDYSEHDRARLADLPSCTLNQQCTDWEMDENAK